RRERGRDGDPARRGRARRFETTSAPRARRARRGASGTLVAVQPLEIYRDRFPILEHTSYLINHSLGAMPVGAEEGLLRYAREWRERGVRAWAGGRWESSTAIGDQPGRIIGAALGAMA